MIRRTLAGWIDPGVRRIQRDADVTWRLFQMQTRRISRLLAARRSDREQLAYLRGELLRVIGERFELNGALTESTARIEELEKQLAAAHRAHDQEERHAARYRLAWVSCRTTRARVREAGQH